MFFEKIRSILLENFAIDHKQEPSSLQCSLCHPSKLNVVKEEVQTYNYYFTHYPAILLVQGVWDKHSQRNYSTESLNFLTAQPRLRQTATAGEIINN